MGLNCQEHSTSSERCKRIPANPPPRFFCMCSFHRRFKSNALEVFITEMLQADFAQVFIPVDLAQPSPSKGDLAEGSLDPLAA